MAWLFMQGRSSSVKQGEWDPGQDQDQDQDQYQYQDQDQAQTPQQDQDQYVPDKEDFSDEFINNITSNR